MKQMDFTLQVGDESPELASSIPMAVFDLYNVITHEFLTANLRLDLNFYLFFLWKHHSFAMYFSLIV